MAKMFAVEYANGHRQEFTAAAPFEALNAAIHEGSRYFLKGAEVSVEAYYAAALTACDAWWARKESTHREIRVPAGSCVGSYTHESK